MAEEKEKTGYSVDASSLKRIGRVVREFETNNGLPPATKRRSRFIGATIEGLMIEDLPGTDDPNVPTKATFQVYSGLQGKDEWGAEPQPSILTLWNRTPSSVLAGDVVFAKELYPDRWHLMVGGGGGDNSLWGTIDEVVCDIDGDPLAMYCWVEVTDFSGGCTAAIPGADQYTGLVQVFQKCDTFTEYYTAEQLVGKTIEAGYYYPRTGYCEPRWIVRQVCGTPECA